MCTYWKISKWVSVQSLMKLHISRSVWNGAQQIPKTTTKTTEKQQERDKDTMRGDVSTLVFFSCLTDAIYEYLSLRYLCSFLVCSQPNNSRDLKQTSQTKGWIRQQEFFKMPDHIFTFSTCGLDFNYAFYLVETLSCLAELSTGLLWLKITTTDKKMKWKKWYFCVTLKLISVFLCLNRL